MKHTFFGGVAIMKIIILGVYNGVSSYVGQMWSEYLIVMSTNLKPTLPARTSGLHRLHGLPQFSTKA